MGILTGAGGYFCAGMDLGAFVRGESPWFGDRGFAGIAQRASRKPLIAAIEGFAVAGGMEIALACDLIVAAKGAKMGIPEAKRSLVAAGGALLRLPRRMPYHVVMELALTGDACSPPSASTSSASSTASQSPAARSRRRSSWPPRSPRTARWRCGLQADPPGAVGLVHGRDVGAPGRDLRPGLRLRGRQGGRERVQGEARPGVAGAVVDREITANWLTASVTWGSMYSAHVSDSLCCSRA